MSNPTTGLIKYGIQPNEVANITRITMSDDEETALGFVDGFLGWYEHSPYYKPKYVPSLELSDGRTMVLIPNPKHPYANR